jgi:hypothetical protein
LPENELPNKCFVASSSHTDDNETKIAIQTWFNRTFIDPDSTKMALVICGPNRRVQYSLIFDWLLLDQPGFDSDQVYEPPVGSKSKWELFDSTKHKLVALNETDLQMVSVEEMSSLINSEPFMVSTSWNRSKLIRAQCPVVLFISKYTALDAFSPIRHLFTVVYV